MDLTVTLLRRVLFRLVLVLGCAALVQTSLVAQTVPPNENETPTPAGSVQWQIGVGFMSSWGGEDPLINILKLNEDNKDLPVDVFDPETQTFLSIPPAQYKWQEQLTVGLLRNGANYNPGFYAGDYIIEWDGDGLIGTGLRGAGTLAVEGPNRIRETYDGVIASWASAQITDIGDAGLRNIRIYRAEHEAALKAGKIFNPDFVRHVAGYDIVRTMDWNAFRRVSKADEIASLDAQFWGGKIVPLEAQFKLAEEAGVSLWLIAPNWLGAPDGLLDRLAAMNERPQSERATLTAENFDAVDASPEWDKYAAMVVAAMEATHYPVDRHFYLELGNETWNWGGAWNPATEWFWGLTRALSDKTGVAYRGNPARGAYGYFSARLAEAFARALDGAGRSGQQWTMVLGAQTAWDVQIIGPLEGVKDYARERMLADNNQTAFAGAGAFRQPMSRYGVATTGYYRGAFHDAGGELFGASVKGAQAWRAQWLARFEADPEGLAQYLSDFMTDPRPRPQNIAWVVSQSLKHQQIATRFGARYIGQYEGSSHDLLDGELAKIPEVVAFYKDWQAGPRHAELIRLQAEQMRAAFADSPDGGGVILSNYQHYSSKGVNPKAPWIFNTLWGEETDAEAALAEVVGE